MFGPPEASPLLTMDLKAILHRSFSLINTHRDYEAICTHVLRTCAEDIEFTSNWDGFQRGTGFFIDMMCEARRHIPDLQASLNSIRLCEQVILSEESCVAEIEYEISGKSVSGVPFFPAGKSVKWSAYGSVTYDRLGQVKAFSVRLTFLPGPRGMEPSILEALAQCTRSLASTSSGCRLLQDAIEASTLPDHCCLVDQLRGHVWEAAGSPHANHVLQKFIVAMPAAKVQFIIDELQGRVVQAATHRIRCRVLERLMEHCSTQQVFGLVEEVLGSVPMLARHPFGNFVVQSMLEHGSAEQRRRLVSILKVYIGHLVRHKIASNVVRTALACCSAEDRELLTEMLRADPQELASLSRHCIGSFVVRELKFQAKVSQA